MGMVNIGDSSAISAVLAPTDLRGAGAMEWDRISGIPAEHPLVSGGDPHGLPYNVDSGKSRIVTTYSTPDIASRQFDTWRDVVNWRDSPVFWVMLASILAFGLVQLSVSARLGK